MSEIIKQIQIETRDDKHYLQGEFPQLVAFSPEFLGDAASTVVETLITLRLENGTATYRVSHLDDFGLIAEKVSA